MAGTASFRRPVRSKSSSISVGAAVSLVQPTHIGTPHYDAKLHGRAGERATINAIESCTHHGCALWIKRRDGTLLLVSARQIVILPS